MEKHALISIRPALSSKRHAQSGCECFVDCLSLYLSLPGGRQGEHDHGDESARLLLENVRVQNDAGTEVAS